MTTPPAPADRLLPLTGAQAGIWNAQRLEPDSPYYVVGDVVEISGGERPIDPRALAEAVRATTEEAESLRLRVYDTPAGPRQTVSDTPVEPPRIIDVGGASDPTAAAAALVEAERARAAETCREMVDRPLYEPVVIRLSDREVWYTQLGHHLVFDGYSGAMLARRTAAHYTALVRGPNRRAAPSGHSRTSSPPTARTRRASGRRPTAPTGWTGSPRCPTWTTCAPPPDPPAAR